MLTPCERMVVASEQQLLLELVPGRDGLVLEWSGMRATFLPKVWEHVAGPRDFLRRLKEKAGLAADFWAADVQVWRYETEIMAAAAPGDARGCPGELIGYWRPPPQECMKFSPERPTCDAEADDTDGSEGQTGGVVAGRRTSRSMAAIRGISACTTNGSSRACSHMGPWALASPTWMAGGTLHTSTSSSHASTGHNSISRLVTASTLAQIVLGRIGNLQARVLSRRVARRHYDLSNDLYVAMLGPTMQYTCAYYGIDGVDRSLDEAQRLKLDLIARKLHLQPGMTVLELGGGFGELAHHLARHHHCRVVSYNISREQVEFARTRCDGLPVEFRLQDYREAASDRAAYDRVVSIGLMEHVGPKNYRHFFEIASARLAPGGLALVHTIGGNLQPVDDRSVDRQVHFPGRRHPVGTPDRRGQGGAPCPGGLAQFRAGLRPYVAGVGCEFPRGMAGAAR